MSNLIGKVKRFVAGVPPRTPTTPTRGEDVIEAKIATLEHIMEVAKTANPPDTETIEYTRRRLYQYLAARREREFYKLSRGGDRGDPNDA